MKTRTFLKIILVLMIGIALFINPIKVKAADPTDLNDIFGDLNDSNESKDNTNTTDSEEWEDQGKKEDIGGNTNTEKPEEKPVETPTEKPVEKPTTTPETNKQEVTKTDLPKAGLAEDTLIIVSVTTLMGVAIYSFKKLSDYQNI